MDTYPSFSEYQAVIFLAIIVHVRLKSLAQVDQVFEALMRHCYFNESADVAHSLWHLSCRFQARYFTPHVSGGLS